MKKRKKKKKLPCTDKNTTALSIEIENLSKQIAIGLAEPKKLVVLTEEEQKKRDEDRQKTIAKIDKSHTECYSRCIKAGDIPLAMTCLDMQAKHAHRCAKNMTISLRINNITKAALDEMSLSLWINPMDGSECKMSQSNWIIVALAEFARVVLKDQISPVALNTNKIDRILMLYIMWSRAERKVEGYSFSSEDKETRLPIGPSHEI